MNTLANQNAGTQNSANNAEPEQDFVQVQIKIATNALNTLADEYMACIEILEDTRLGHSPEETAGLQMRMAKIERYFRKIGSNIERYAEV